MANSDPTPKSISRNVTVTGSFTDFLTLTTDQLKATLVSPDGTVLDSNVKAYIATLLYDTIKALVASGSTSQADFKTAVDKLLLADAALPATPDFSSGPTTRTYPMPDIQGGQIVVTFAATPIKDATAIKAISFAGEKP